MTIITAENGTTFDTNFGPDATNYEILGEGSTLSEYTGYGKSSLLFLRYFQHNYTIHFESRGSIEVENSFVQNPWTFVSEQALGPSNKTLFKTTYEHEHRIGLYEQVIGSDNDQILNGLGEVDLHEYYSLDNLSGRYYVHNDQIFGLGGDDIISGFAGDDMLSGGTGDDVLNGGIGADDLFGGLGEDVLNGDEGNDTAFGGAGDDELNGGDGSDNLNGDTGNDTLNGGAGNDTLNGDEGDDTLNGDAGNDNLNGGAGNDIMRGGTGNDVLNGGSGYDQMLGGEGADRFIFNDASAVDDVVDFSSNEGDTLVIDTSAYGATAGADVSVVLDTNDFILFGTHLRYADVAIQTEEGLINVATVLIKDGPMLSEDDITLVNSTEREELMQDAMNSIRDTLDGFDWFG
ncbi:MAG: calcium-binding protein [Pseudomonadota bacterium]